MQFTGVLKNKNTYRKNAGYSKDSAFITKIVIYFAQNYFF